tara:strand:- start:390 stop:950 length:561 start_codon:yes stop_codon:yes gene_type:complete
MGDLTIGTKAVLSQSGSAEAVLSGDLTFPVGHVLQVFGAVKTDVETYTTTSTWTNIDDITQAITLSSASNKVLMSFTGCFGTTDTYHHFIRFARGGTGIGVGDSAGSRTQAGAKIDWGDDAGGDQNGMRSVGMQFIEAPGSVGPHTYTVQYLLTGGTMYVNRADVDSDGANAGRTICTLTLTEIVA